MQKKPSRKAAKLKLRVKVKKRTPNRKKTERLLNDILTPLQDELMGAMKQAWIDALIYGESSIRVYWSEGVPRVIHAGPLFPRLTSGEPT